MDLQYYDRLRMQIQDNLITGTVLVESFIPKQLIGYGPGRVAFCHARVDIR